MELIRALTAQPLVSAQVSILTNHFTYPLPDIYIHSCCFLSSGHHYNGFKPYESGCLLQFTGPSKM